MKRVQFLIIKFLDMLFLKIPSLFMKRYRCSIQNPENILFIGYMGLGNMILFLPTIRIIRRKFPEGKITILGDNKTGCFDILDSEVDEKYIFDFQNASMFQKLRFIIKVRKGNFDTIICNFHGASYRYLAYLIFYSGTQFRVGHVSSPGWKSVYDYVFNFPVTMEDPEHESIRDIRLIQSIGIEEKKLDIYLNIEENLDRKALNLLSERGINTEDNIVAIQMGTSPTMKWKQWKPERFGKLACNLVNELDMQVIFLGSSGEREMLLEVIRNFKLPKENVFAGDTSIIEAAAILKLCRLLICNDSGLMHLAAAVKTPLVAIYGPTDYKRTAPLSEKFIIFRKDIKCSPCFRLDGTLKVKNCKYRECLESISVEEIFSVVSTVLQNENKYINK